jgi:hypothetical protein
VYESKFIRHPRKFITHWLGPYEIAYVTEGGAAQLNTEGRMERRISEWESAEVVL